MDSWRFSLVLFHQFNCFSDLSICIHNFILVTNLLGGPHILVLFSGLVSIRFSCDQPCGLFIIMRRTQPLCFYSERLCSSIRLCSLVSPMLLLGGSSPSYAAQRLEVVHGLRSAGGYYERVFFLSRVLRFCLGLLHCTSTSCFC